MVTASPARQLERSRLVEFAVLRGRSSVEFNVWMFLLFKTQHKAQIPLLALSDILLSTFACSAEKDTCLITRSPSHVRLNDFFTTFQIDLFDKYKEDITFFGCFSQLLRERSSQMSTLSRRWSRGLGWNGRNRPHVVRY